MEFFQPFSNKGLGRPARHCNGKVLETRLKFSYTGLGGVWVTVWGFKSRRQSRALTCLVPRPTPRGQFVLGHLVWAKKWVSRKFASDTSPKWIDRKGLGKRRTGTREGTDHRKLSSITWNFNFLSDRTFKLWASKQQFSPTFSPFFPAFPVFPWLPFSPWITKVLWIISIIF